MLGLHNTARRHPGRSPASRPCAPHPASVTTIEGLAGAGGLHPVQQAFVREGAMQCGYCTPGMILRTVALRERAPSPTRAQILEALDGSLCRCNGYPRIVAAVEPAARLRRSAAQKQEGVHAAE
ncbi:MAG: (2Fe-2S)-binding protein [Bryobacteraceae bacterium]